MNDREKAIRGLELCTSSGFTCAGDCDVMNDCPYYAGSDGCMTPLMRDALALLKAQEPRVLALEELPNWDGTFLVEVRGCKNGAVWASYYAEYELGGDAVIRMIDIDGGVDDRLKNLYGYEWRCWTARPTDEQREATTWIS